MKVEARYRGKSKYYPGTISRVRLNGTVDINYDDGERELGVKPELVRVLEDKRSSSRSPSRSRSSRDPEPRVGDKCEAQFKGKGKFYPGKIISQTAAAIFSNAIDWEGTPEQVRILKKKIKTTMYPLTQPFAAPHPLAAPVACK